MPCYTEWDAYLRAGTPEYDERRAVPSAKLEAGKHVADYYYGGRHHPVPEAVQFSAVSSSLSPDDEDGVFDMITHHFACDEVTFTDLYDIVTLLDRNDQKNTGYARVLMTCANRLRADRSKYIATDFRHRELPEQKKPRLP